MGNALWGREALADGRDGVGARLLTGCADRRSVAIKELKRARYLLRIPRCPYSLTAEKGYLLGNWRGLGGNRHHKG